LKFDELWEWDEASKGDYDKQGWDFITVDMSTVGLWIDHCEFTKAYDGVVDIKGASAGVTISWCKFSGDSGEPGSFVRQQIDALEAAAPTANPMYSFLRSNGFSVDDIVAVVRSQKKGHLIGALEMDDGNANLTVTLHHNWYVNMQDRMPRLRAGNAHAYNIYVSNGDARAARARRDEVVVAMSPASAAKLQGDAQTYKFTVTLNGAISTEGGAVLLEASHLIDVLSPVRNNQVDAAMPAFTGKIRVVDTIYSLDGTVFRGGSDDTGGALSPVPAPVLPFSWNGFADLPYRYTTDAPESLATRLTGPDGAGAGRLTWEKSNWMKTMY
jgi:pectate lyase